MKRFLLSIFFLISTHVVLAQPVDPLDKNSEQSKVVFRDSVATDPLLIRMYAEPFVPGVQKSPSVATPGDLNETFGTNGGRDLTSVFGANTQAQAIRILLDGRSLIGVNDPDNNRVKVARFDGDGYLDDSFASSGIAIIAQENVTDIYVDAIGRIVVIGAGTSGSWIARLSSEGVLDTDNFNNGLFGSPAGMSVGNVSDGFFAVGQQQSGRLIVGAKDNSFAGVLAFRADGKLDESFAVTIPGSQTVAPWYQRGKIVVTDAAGKGVYDLAIDPTTDAIYAAYVDTSNRATIAKILADGDDFDTAFGTDGAIATAHRISNITTESQVRVVIDQNGKIVLAAVNATHQYVVRRYLATGGVDTSFNGDGSALVVSGSETAIITHLMMTQANQMIVIGYDNDADNNMIMFRVNANGTLDTAFSPDGILPYQFDTDNIIRQARYGAIHPTGQILTVGFEHDGEVDVPLVVNVYGDSFVPEYKQAPGETAAGTLDTTFNDGTSPTVIVNDITGLSTLSGKMPKLMHVFYETPGYLLVAQDGISTYLTKLTQDMQLDESFNEGALLQVTTGTTSSSVNGIAFDRYSGDVDSHQKFFLVGTNTASGNSTPWALHYNFAGEVDSDFVLVPASGMTTGNVINQQSFGRSIIAGSTSSVGILSAHDIYGNLDLGFGSGTGTFTVTGSTVIYAMVIDEQDRILVAFKDAADRLSIVRIDQSGLAVDSTFSVNVGVKISSVSAQDQVKLALDNNGDIVVAATTSTGYKVRRYSAASGALDATFNGTGELSFAFSMTTGTPKITQLTVDSNGKILVAGFNDLTGDYRAIQVRLTAAGYLDTSFNTDGSPQGDGILEINNDSQDFEFYSQGIQLDRRIMLFGKDAVTGDMLLTRIFGDDYVSAIQSEPSAGVYGAADISLENTGYTNLTTLVGASKVKVVRAIEAGKTLIAIDTGSLTKLVRLTTQSTLDSTFSGSGIATTTCPTGVFDMFVDSDGKILVLGTSGSSGRIGGSGATSSWLRRYNADGSNDTSFGSVGLTTTNIDYGYNVKIQQGGRILVSGFDGAAGCLIAYTSHGVLDTSFGNGTGKIAIGTTGIYNFVIDSNDKIYIAYDNGSGAVILACYRSNGAGLNLDFGIEGMVTNALQATVTGADQIFVGLDQDENVLVAGATSTTLVVARYDSTGILDEEFGSSGYTTIADTGVTLKDFLIGTSGQVDSESIMALVGYKNFEDDLMHIAWVNQDGDVDTSYNPTGVDEGIPGTVDFEVNEAYAIRQLKSGVILNDGRIVVVGYETTTLSVDTPLLMRRYSQRYAPQQAQAPTFGLLGTLDPSLNGSGTLAYNFTSGVVDQFSSSIWSLDNGFFLIGGYGTIDTDEVKYHFILSKVGSDGIADTEFGNDGVVTTPLTVSGSNEYLTDITVDYLDRIVAVGYSDSDSGVSLIRRYSDVGVLDTTFGDKTGNPLRPTGTAAQLGMKFYVVGMQLNGRLIVGGTDVTENKGILVAYDFEGVLDPTFGDGGFVYISDSTSIHSLVIDADDSILVTYKNGSGRANITRVQDNGQPYTIIQPGSLFGTSGTIIDVFGSEIASTETVKIALDSDRKIVVAASMNARNTMQMRRYLLTGIIDPLFNSGDALTITIGSEDDRSFVSRVMANNVGQYVIVGYEDYSASTERPLVAQVTNSGALDTEFNALGTPGYNVFTIPGGGIAQELRGAVISPEGKIIGVGQELLSEHFKPVGISMFDTQFSDEVNRAPDFVAEGGFDTTFDTDGKASVYAGGASNSASNQEIMAVAQLANLKLMTIVSDGSNSWTVRVNQDGNNDETYGYGTGLAIGKRLGTEVVNQMRLDGAGNMMVVGTHEIFGGYLKRIISNGTMNPLFGGNLGDPSGTLYNIMSEVYGVVQLTTGSMLVFGNDNNIGTAKMILPTSGTDTTFVGGSYINGLNIASVAVDADDNIFMAIGYLDGESKKVRLVKMNSVGVIDSSFGGGTINSVISDIDDYVSIRLTLDADGNVVVCASQGGTSGQIQVVRYTPAGVFDDQFNLGQPLDILFSGETSVVTTGLVAFENNEIMVSGYQNGGDFVTNNDQWFVVQLRSSGMYDDEFNMNGQTSGQLTFQVSTSLQRTRHNNDILVQKDGKVVFAGGESPAANQSTPLLVRILNTDDMHSVSQFPGTSSTLPDSLYPDYGTDGISESEIIPTLLEGGFLVVDGSDRINVGGLTGDSRLVVARFDDTGEIDTTYNIDGTTQGVAVSPVINNLSQGGSVAIDGNGKIVAGGYTSDKTLAAVRFTTGGIADTTFAGDGLAQTPTITNLTNGGFVAVDASHRVLVGGITSDYKLAVARFTAIGDADGFFGTSGVAQTSAITGLSEGGFIVTDSSSNVYVGGYTTTGTLVVAKFNDAGVLLTGSFGTSGIAQTVAIDDLEGIGSVAVDSLGRVVIGGYTSSENLVVVRFTTAGIVDEEFNGTGIQSSAPITGLTIGGFITIDSLNRVVVGGFVTSSTSEKNMVATRFLADDGACDDKFGDAGIASTGTITNLTQGGFVAVDSLDRVVTGGLVTDSGNGQLIAAKLYSGDEIVIPDPRVLSPIFFKILRYGNERFRKIIKIDYFLSLIENLELRDAIGEKVNDILDSYVAKYGDNPEYNLVLNFYKTRVALELASVELQRLYPPFVPLIAIFFVRLLLLQEKLNREAF